MSQEAFAQQYARPSSDVTPLNIWSPSTGTVLFDMINEITASDTDYIVSSSNSTGFDEVNLSSVTDPVSSSSHIIRARARQSGGTPAKTVTLQVHLYEGATLRASTADTSLPTNGSYVDISYTLSGAEADAITNYANLRLRFTVTSNGGAGKQAFVTWAEFEVPTFVASVTYTQNDFEWFVTANSVTLTNPWPPGTGTDLTENQVFGLLPFTNDALASADQIRIQMNFSISGAALSASAQSFQLEYVAATDCTTATGWASVGAKASGTIWRLFDEVSIGDSTTQVNDISTSTASAEGYYSEINPTAVNPNDVQVGESSEWDWPLENNGAAENTTYCFRMAKSGGTAFNVYNADSYPKLTTAPGMSALMRHGNLFASDIEQGFYWAN